MNKKTKAGSPQAVSTEESSYEECDPTTQIEIYVNHDQEELRTLIEKFDDEAEAIDTPDDTVVDDVSELRQNLAQDHAPVISDFVDNPSNPKFYNYSSSPDFPPKGEGRPQNCYRHYSELMAMVRSYEKMLGDEHNLGVSLQHYPELKLIRLLSISVFSSGSVILLGMGNDQMPINIFEKIDQLSLAVVPMKRNKSKTPRTEVSFFFHEQSD